MESNKQLFEKISGYYSGEADRDEIKNGLSESAESKNVFDWVDQFWNKIFPFLDHRADIQVLTNKKIDRSDKIRRIYVSAMKYAAALILIAGVSSVFFIHKSKNINIVMVYSSIGEVKTVDLPDGSKAWLNAQSSLSFPESFTGSSRELRMNGEVYFEVKHDVGHPFIVISEYMKVKVLGTSFMISSYANEPAVSAHLAEGSIELSMDNLNRTEKLVPGDELILNKTTLKVRKMNNPNSAFDSWRLGKISFYNESLYDIARKLERKFGSKIHISEENIGNMKCTADFDSENLEQILNYFGHLQGIQYKAVSDGYLLIKK